MGYQQASNYMARFLSDKSKDIIESIIEKHRIAEEEAKKPKPRKKRGAKR